MSLKAVLVVLGATTYISVSAEAGPMTETGNSSLKTDLSVLAGAGVIDNITMSWPLPWAGIEARINSADLYAQPASVRNAARRVMAEASGDTTEGLFSGASFSATTDPSVVRGFDATPDSTLQGQFMTEGRWKTTTLHLSLGARTTRGGDKQIYNLDGSYIDQRIGPVEMYAGWKQHWWGPGWISALSLSNNARPMPQIGITRSRTDAFESPWLSWLGPWQIEMFGGVLNGQRRDKNTGFVAFRFDFNPLSGLEIGLSRLTEICGEHHSCSPVKDYFDIDNNDAHVNNTNDQGNIDIRYTGMAGGIGYGIYAQLMNEDTNPLWHSGTSHLFGGSLWAGVPGGTGRVTVEYANSIASHDVWGGGTLGTGFAYNNGRYYDGWRYRGRTMGFSLDSGSRLYSLQAQYVRDEGDSYSLSFHHAEINAEDLVAGTQWRNVVSDTPVTINTAEISTRWPFAVNGRKAAISLSARVADDQPRPDHGWTGAVETRLTLGF